MQPEIGPLRITFVLLTPAGWASTYLGLSGTVRGVAAAIDDPFGDPVLTALDTLCLRIAHTTRGLVAKKQRESLEGPEVHDRVVRGAQVGMASAELVIISARRKPQWDVGTVVDTGDRWFRVVSVEDRTFGGWLRTCYGLNEHRDHEVIRRAAQYSLPAHWRGPAG